MVNSRKWFCSFLAVVSILMLCGCDEDQTQSVTQQDNLADSTAERKIVRFETSKGDILIELDEQAAPVTVANFIEYVESGFYDGTIFHRITTANSGIFVIQGGGFTDQLEKKQTRAPIINEAANGLKNERGTISMAMTRDPDSATSQFFINYRTNSGLDYMRNLQAGYAVFGKIIEGMDVVDAIAAVETTTKTYQDGGQRPEVPVENIYIISAELQD